MADPGFNGTNAMSFQLTKILTWIIFFPWKQMSAATDIPYI